MTVCGLFCGANSDAVRKALVLLLSTAMIWSNIVYALPEGFTPVNPNSASTYTVNGTSAVVNQTQRVEQFNWDSFNIGALEHLHFQQLVDYIAINYDLNGQSPSEIAGRLTADGSVFLINRNGILFRNGAQIDVGRTFVASTLEPNIVGELSEYSLRQAMDNGQPTFFGGGDSLVLIEEGASLNGEKVMIFSPRVENNGVINVSTDREDGAAEVVLASGDEVFLMSPETNAETDNELAGFLVEVSGSQCQQAGGSVSCAVTNEGDISVSRGSATLAGLVVNQNGRLNATASTNTNGVIRLLGRGQAAVSATNSSQGYASNANPFFYDGQINITSPAIPTQKGTVTLGDNSETSVTAERYASNALYDAMGRPLASRPAGSLQAGPNDLQAKPIVEIVGESVTLEKNANVVAEGGDINISATSGFGSVDDVGQGRLVMKEGAAISASGATNAVIPMGRNSIAVDGTGVTLADVILQRDDILRRSTVYLDGRARQQNTTADIIKSENSANLLERTAAERLIDGGEVNITADGSVIQHENAVIAASGGQKTFAGGEMLVSYLVNGFDRVLVNNADPNIRYAGIQNVSRFSPSFVVAGNGGEISINAPTATFSKNGLQARAGAPGVYQSGDNAPKGGGLSIDLDVSPDGNELPYTQNLVLATEALYREHTEALFSNTSDEGYSPDTTVMHESLLQDGGFNKFFANIPGSVRVASGAKVSMRPDGTFNISRKRPLVNDAVFDAAGNEIGDTHLIDVAGDIVIPSGEITFTTSADDSGATALQDGQYAFALRDGATIDVSGLLINSIAREGNTRAVDAGSVKIDVSGGFVAETGTAFLMDGGANITGSSSIKFGDAGSLDIATNAYVLKNANGQIVETIESPMFDLDSRVSAIGEGSNTLSLRASGYSFGSEQAEIGDAHFVEQGVNITQNLLNSGFSQFNFTFFSSGAKFQPQTYNLNNRVWRPTRRDFTFLPTSTQLSDVAEIAVVAPYLDAGVSLSISGVSENLVADATLGDIVIGEGVRINASAESTLSLKQSITESDIIFDGFFVAPGGVLSVDVEGTLTDDRANGAVFGANTYVDVSGAVIQNPFFPLNAPRVVNAGTLDFSATNAFLLSESGAYFDISGERQIRAGVYANRQVRSNFEWHAAAGELRFNVTDTPLWFGAVNAAAPSSGQLGGSIIVDMSGVDPTLDAIPETRLPGASGSRNVLETPNIYLSANNHDSDLLDLLIARDAQDNITGVVPDIWDVIDQSNRITNNQVRLSSSWLESLGFGALTGIVPNSVRTNADTPSTFGELRLDSGLSLRDFYLMDFDVHTVSVLAPEQSDSVVPTQLEADWFSLGYDRINQNDSVENSQYAAADAPELGSNTLEIHAGFIDLQGNLGFKGTDIVEFASETDIRLRSAWGALGGDGDTLKDNGNIKQQFSAEMLFPNTVKFVAQQMYLGTLDRVTVSTGVAANRGQEGRIEIGLPNAPSQIDVPLSVNSVLNLESAHIIQGGNLLLPNGEINFVAPQHGGIVEFLEGGVTSTSLDRKTVLLGEVLEETYWTYPVGDAAFAYGEQFDQSTATLKLPEKAINITADRIYVSGDAASTESLRQINKNAVLDLSGGGNIVAYEFLPGAGGSIDILEFSNGQGFSSSNLQGAFAVLPNERRGIAPVDIVLGGSSEGYSITFASNTVGVPAGTYTILPARYAMLPGAYLVRATDDKTPFLPAYPSVNTLGSAVVAGKLSRLGGAGLSPNWTGFVVESSQLVNQRSQYELYSLSSFFGDLDNIGLTNDAGIARFIAGNELELDGLFLSNVGDNTTRIGRGLAVDVVADNLDLVYVTEESNSNTQLTLDSLRNLNAESLLLGGLRSSNADAFDIETIATSISVQGSGASVGEQSVLAGSRSFIFTANEDVVIGQGAVVDTGPLLRNGSARKSIGIDPNSVFLRVSSEQQADLRFNGDVNPTGTSTLTISDGASISGDAGVALYARDEVDVQTLQALSTPSLNLAAPTISIGDPLLSGDVSGTVLGSALFNDLSTSFVEELIITSASTIDLYAFRSVLGSAESANIAVDGDLHFVASDIRAMDSDLEATVSADRIFLRPQVDSRNSDSVTAASVNDGVLNFQAREITIGNTKRSNADDSKRFSFSGLASLVFDAVDTLILGAAAVDVRNDSASTEVIIDAPLVTAGSGTNFELSDATSITMTNGNTRSTDYRRNLERVGIASSISLSANTIEVDTVVDSVASDFLIRSTASAVQSETVTLTENALVDMSGDLTTVAGRPYAVDRRALVSIDAGEGAFDIGDGAVIDVSGPNLGGTVKLTSRASSQLDGELRGNSAGNVLENGGALFVDVGGLSNSHQDEGINIVSSAQRSGGFTRELFYRQRANDMAFSSGSLILAPKVTLIADQGSVDFEGRIDASNVDGGTVSIFAQEDLRIAGGAEIDVSAYSIDAIAALPEQLQNIDSDGDAGQISLSSRNGTIELGDATGAAQFVMETRGEGKAGELELFAAGSTTAGGAFEALDINVVNASISSNTKVTAYNNLDFSAIAADGVIDASDITSVEASVNNFMAEALASEEQRLLTGFSGVDSVSIAPHVVISSETDLTIADEIDTLLWRYGDEGDLVGELTLRTEANLIVSANVSDGVRFLQSDTAPCGRAFCGEEAIEGESWSFSMISGADLNSASWLESLSANEISATELSAGGETLSAASLLVGDDVHIRTGTGDLKLHSAGDLWLSNENSAVYTTGELVPRTSLIDVNVTLSDGSTRVVQVENGLVRYAAGGGTIDAAADITGARDIYGFAFHPSLSRGQREFNNIHFGRNGGDIDLDVSGDVGAGAASVSTPYDWYKRYGGNSLFETSLQDRARVDMWASSFTQFGQAFGLLGGGSLNAEIGGSINQVGFAAPTAGKQIGNVSINPAAPTSPLIEKSIIVDGESVILPLSNVVEVLGGGDINVSAGGSITGSYVLLDRGEGVVTTGGSFGVTTGALISEGAVSYGARQLPHNSNQLYVGDAQLALMADDDVNIDLVTNTSLIASSSFDNAQNGSDSYHFNYSDASSLSVDSFGGDVRLAPASEILASTLYSSTINSDPRLLGVLPGQVGINALNGSLLMDAGVLSLFPSASQSLRLIIGENVLDGGKDTNSVNQGVYMSRGDQNNLPVLMIQDNGSAEILNAGLLDALSGPDQILGVLTSSGNESFRYRGFADGASFTDNPVEVSIGGSSLAEQANGLDFSFSRPAVVTLAGDLIDTGFDFQNISPADVSTLSVAGDLLFQSSLDGNANITTSSVGVSIDGPGVLNVLAGGDIDLGASNGIFSLATLAADNGNRFLPEGSAALNVLAGVNLDDMVNNEQFTDEYIYDSASLLAYVATGQLAVDLSMPEFADLWGSDIPTGTEDSQQRFIELVAQGDMASLQSAYAIANQAFDLARDDVRVRLVLDQLYNELRLAGAEQNTDVANYDSIEPSSNLLLDLVNDVVESVSSDAELAAGFRTNILSLSAQQTSGQRVSNNPLQRGYTAINALFPGSAVYPMPSGFEREERGSLALTNSQLATLKNRDINVLVPYGSVDVGLSVAGEKSEDQLGFLSQGSGSVSVYASGDVNVNQSRVFALDGGDVLMFSSLGDINAGIGARDLLSIPEPRLATDGLGNTFVFFPFPIAGSGVKAECSSVGCNPSNADINAYAPNGLVDGGDAGFTATGSITVVAETVVNTEFFQAGEDIVGVPNAEGVDLDIPTVDDSSDADKAAEEQLQAVESEDAAGNRQIAFVTIDVLKSLSGESDSPDFEEMNASMPGSESPTGDKVNCLAIENKDKPECLGAQ